MLTTRAIAEVLACYEDTSAVGRVVEHEVLVQCAVGIISPVAKQVVAKEFFLAGSSFEKTGRYNLVGVYVLQLEGYTR